MDFGLSSEQRLLGESVRKVMDRLATPQYVRRLDSEAAYPYELYDAWTEMGLLRMPFPEAHGGLGGTLLDMVIIAEELRARASTSSLPTARACSAA
jgi:Acyl-CoA dehydrogenases